MEKSFFKRALWEVLKTALTAAAFCLLAESLFAIIIRACSPSQEVITAVNWILKGLGIFAFSLIFIRRERAFLKGIAAGIVTSVLTMLMFAAIGGGFHVGLLYLAELPFCAVLGGAAALLGVKLRKE